MSVWTISIRDYDTCAYPCHKTGELFYPDAINTIEDAMLVWVLCPFCDLRGHTADQDEYDKSAPTPHCFTLVSESEAAHV